MRGMNPQQLRAVMRRMGIKSEELKGVEEVIIKTAEKDYVVRDAAVTVIEVQGEKTFQIAGRVEEVAKEGAIPIEDIKLVAEQAGVSEEEAKKALEEVGGEPAEAIIYLTTR